MPIPLQNLTAKTPSSREIRARLWRREGVLFADVSFEAIERQIAARLAAREGR